MSALFALPRVMFVCDYEYCGSTHRWLETLSALNRQDWRHALAVQVRIKNQSEAKYRALAEQAKSVLPVHVRTVLNGDALVARDLGYDGVHLPQDRLAPLPELKHLNWVSIAVHRSSDLTHCDTLGAHSVVVAPVFQTEWKTVNPFGYAQLRRFAVQSTVPVYALGGINLNNIEKCLEKNIYGVAVLSSVMKAQDPIERLNQFLNFFENEAEF